MSDPVEIPKWILVYLLPAVLPVVWGLGYLQGARTVWKRLRSMDNFMWRRRADAR